jgi:hypothetical protein
MRPLPTDPRERVLFCLAYGDKFDGDNHDDALAYARFAVMFAVGMGSTELIGLKMDGKTYDWPSTPNPEK